LSSSWRPLSRPLYRRLWVASLLSHVGTWIHGVGAAWLMTSLAPSPAWVALVPAASSLPFFLLSLPAGVAADTFDRRRLLLVSQGWMLAAAAGLGALTLGGLATPALLLGGTFLLGLGAALNGPAWQTIIPSWSPARSSPPRSRSAASRSTSPAPPARRWAACWSRPPAPPRPSCSTRRPFSE
jgi:MFS family permease